MNPNPSDTTNVLLTQLIVANSGSPTASDPIMLPQTEAWAQPLAYASFSLSLLAAFGAVLGKQWLSHYKSNRFGHGSLEERCAKRQDKFHGLQAWYLDAMLQSFPVLLQISLFIFAVALSAYVWTQQAASSRIVIAVTASGVLLYSFLVYASLRSPDCPFQTPASAIIRLTWDILLRTRPAWKTMLRLAKGRILHTRLGREIMRGTVREYVKDFFRDTALIGIEQVQFGSYTTC